MTVRKCALAIAILVCMTSQAWAANALVQVTSCTGNDATCTFSAAPSASNVVIILSGIASEAQTLSVTGWTPTVNTLICPQDSTTDTIRVCAWCTVGDGADTTFVLTTSGGGSANTAAIEVSGPGSCSDVDDYEIGEGVATTTHGLGTTLTTTQSGDFMVGFAHAANTVNFTATGSPDGTIDAGDADINNSALGQYKLLGGAGSYDVTFSSAASETTIVVGVALKEAGGGGGVNHTMLSMMGVGD